MSDADKYADMIDRNVSIMRKHAGDYLTRENDELLRRVDDLITSALSRLTAPAERINLIKRRGGVIVSVLVSQFILEGGPEDVDGFIRDFKEKVDKFADPGEYR